MALGLGASLALAGGSSIFSGGLQGLMQNLSNRRANKRMVDFWKMQNEYNHPKAQMQRLQEAGLNPNLIYGDSVSGATGRAESIGRPENTTWNFDNPMNKLNMFADIGQKRAQTNNLETLNNVYLQDAALRSAQAANETLRGVGLKLDNTVKRELVQTSIDAQKEANRQLELKTIGLQIDNMVKSQTAADAIKRVFYEANAAKENVKYIKAGTALRELETSLKNQGLENAPFWARWIYRHIEFDGNMLDFKP